MAEKQIQSALEIDIHEVGGESMVGQLESKQLGYGESCCSHGKKREYGVDIVAGLILDF